MLLCTPYMPWALLVVIVLPYLYAGDVLLWLGDTKPLQCIYCLWGKRIIKLTGWVRVPQSPKIFIAPKYR
jgi:hypothetical protein